MLPLEYFYNEKPLANILSFAVVSCRFRIIVDTDLERLINVQLNGGTKIMFKPFRGGLYYYDMTKMKHNTINSKDNGYTFLNTVENNKAYLHQRKTKGADKARILQQPQG